MGLVALLRSYGEPIEADLLRYYGLDILDLGSERLSWRRLARLIVRLPRESCTARAVDQAATMWADTEYLLALVVDGLNATNYLLRSAPHFKHPPRKPPQPIWRPGDRRPEVVDGTELLAQYEALMTVIEAQTGSPRGIATTEEATSNGS